MEWNDEQIRTLKRLWSEGYSAGQIETVLGRSRSSILGKVHRLGLATRGKATRSMRPRMKVKKAKPAPKSEPNPATKLSGLRPRQPTPLPVVMEQKSNPPLKGIHELEPKDCRFPIGDPRESGFGFCGKPVSSGRVYCRDHLLESVNRDHRKRLAAILGETEGMEEAA